MFCSKCGYEMNDDAKFCSSCGHSNSTAKQEVTINFSFPEISSLITKYASIRNTVIAISAIWFGYLILITWPAYYDAVTAYKTFPLPMYRSILVTLENRMIGQTFITFAALIVGWKWTSLLANPEKSPFEKTIYYGGLVVGYGIAVIIILDMIVPTY